VQAIISAIVLLVCQINESPQSAYQFLVDAATILYFLPFLYMYAGVIKLAGRKDRGANGHAVLIPGGTPGVWIAGGLGLLVTVAGIVLSLVPPGETPNKLVFEIKLVSGTVATVVIGLALYLRGARAKESEAAQRSTS
jgi:amino acid transporter